MSFVRLHQTLRLSALALGIALGFAGPLPLAQAQNSGLINTSPTHTWAQPITAGSTQLRLQIPVAALSDLRLQLVLPVSGAHISLLDPQGQEVIAANDPRISFLDGAQLSPPLPGGVFITPSIANPADGVWTLQANFPAAPVPTVAILSSYAQSPYQVGMVISGQSFRVGQPVPLGMLVLHQGLPMTHLAPSLSISKDGNPLATLNAVDNGQAADFDGLADDGIYSQGYRFGQTGRYQIDGKVSIPAPGGGSIQRSATAFVDIVPANFVFGSVSGTVIRDASGCVRQLDVNLSGTVASAGTYSTAGTLLSSGGPGSLLKRSNVVLSGPGALNAKLSYTASEIRKSFAADGDFIVDPLDVLAFSGQSPRLEMRKPSATSFSGLTLAQFCSAPIELANAASVNPVLRNGFIGQLEFSLPVRVNVSDSYQISFKVLDAQGLEVGQFGLNNFLNAGDNRVSATVMADKLQRSDGPYRIESVLVVGGGSTAQASRIPVGGSSLSRWQIFPTISGDLNGDGSVNTADRDLLLQFRGQSPLIPGDRRDLNGDGKIDLQDARLLILKACAAPNCPKN
ncbi:hypothetical protein HNP55_003510 [Paucibacter oligotrophus]|uniref:Dockerin domain-containing protein n=1 Tax=Roseateles oligotrophus TaxID=1769250 RepID=A0A840L8R1_9BURK|nr:dockerin type I repeat-containing protein [Roseateles oligotrophus]MBB4844964.1 hypothetical protein [Roseateles oligotrophus]